MQMPPMVVATSSNPAYMIGEGPADEGDLDEVMERLGSSDAMICREAADDLHCLRRKAASASTALTGSLANPLQRVWLLAAAALEQINREEIGPSLRLPQL